MTALAKSSQGIRRREPEAEARQYLTFTLGEDVYGVAIGKVREIVEFHTLTQIPLMPAFLRGVTSLRGAVILLRDTSLGDGERFSCDVLCISPTGCSAGRKRQDDAVIGLVRVPESVLCARIHQATSRGYR